MEGIIKGTQRKHHLMHLGSYNVPSIQFRVATTCMRGKDLLARSKKGCGPGYCVLPHRRVNSATWTIVISHFPSQKSNEGSFSVQQQTHQKVVLDCGVRERDEE